MKTKFDIKSILCGAMLGVGTMFIIGAAARETHIEWEYGVEWIALNRDNPALNTIQIGSVSKDGWELLSAQILDKDQTAPALVLRRRAKQK